MRPLTSVQNVSLWRWYCWSSDNSETSICHICKNISSLLSQTYSTILGLLNPFLVTLLINGGWVGYIKWISLLWVFLKTRAEEKTVSFFFFLQHNASYVLLPCLSAVLCTKFKDVHLSVAINSHDTECQKRTDKMTWNLDYLNWDTKLENYYIGNIPIKKYIYLVV